ncbi:hypothetical protein ACLB3A_07155 [Corynebacterium freneyi]|uniref:hypothetical protein n=1 Tax=Corynebacterium freneyi TaxID=134034 RepID=UPI00396C8EC1
MADSFSITTDAPIADVVAILRGSALVNAFRWDGEFEAYRMGTPLGGYVTMAEDLKIDADEMETWLDVYEQEDSGLQFRLFDLLRDSLDVRVTRGSRDGEKSDPGETIHGESVS